MNVLNFVKLSIVILIGRSYSFSICSDVLKLSKFPLEDLSRVFEKLLISSFTRL